MRQITKSSVLVFAGTAVIGIAHIPAPKHKPSAEVVANYIHAKWYNPQINNRDWIRSEARKQELMSNIRTIRTQIRAKARIHTGLIETCAATMMNKSRSVESKLKQERAAQLHTLPRYINYETLMKKQGIVRIDLG